MRRVIHKFVHLFLSIFFIAILIRTFIGEPCRISSGSMEPTVMAGDWLWIDKVSYGAILPARWSDIPLVNIFTWIPSLREKDMETNWGYHRLKGLRMPQENDLIIFKSPENKEVLLVKRISQILQKGTDLIINPDNFIDYKEIIIRENNTVELQNNSISINGKPMTIYRVQNNYYFVLGDNPQISRDSRFFGYVNEKEIIGKVNRIIFSQEKWKKSFRTLK
ncbi:signal peptidase I [Proteiniphilum sp. X52]|nr:MULTISPECIES: signal peptidase I [Proteiniphilum]RNC63770.1 signal peptidase I [Proteiniphilum sp. X52]